MDLVSLLRLMARRSWVVVPVLALTFGAVAYVSMNGATAYGLEGTYLLLASSETTAAPDAAVATEALADLLSRPSVATEFSRRMD